mgnify:CR=1 FL=1
MSELFWKGKWNQLKGKAKQQWANLTDDDLMYVEGKEEELYGKMQEKTGKSRDEIKSWFDEQMKELEK